MSIAVVVPTYNGVTFIARTLECVFRQTSLPEEIIVVDDASTDGTPDLVERVANDSPVPFRLIRKEKNSGGPAAPMNLGMRETRSAYVALCEQDDRMFPQKLERLSRCAQLAPDAALILSRYRVIRHGESELASQISNDSYSRFDAMPKQALGENCHILDQRSALLSALKRCFAISFSNMLFRKAAWDELGGLDESIRAAADHDLLIRTAHCFVIGFVDEQLWEFHRHAASLVEKTDRLRSRTDYGRIWKREYERTEDREIRAILKYLLRKNRERLACWHRERGEYLKSLAFYWRSLSETGPSLSSAVGAAILLPHLLKRSIQNGRNSSRLESA